MVGDQPPAGVFVCDGARFIQLDVVSTSGAGGAAGSIDLLAWDPILAAQGLQGWVVDTTWAVAGGAGPTRLKTTANLWASRFCYARVTLIGANASNYALALSAGMLDG